MASNTVWWNGTNDMAWGQINNSTSTNSATFNGPDGTWLITNDVSQMSPSNMYINASGYSFYGDPLDLTSSGANSALVVAPGKTVNF
jgi:hypothetical protein